MKQLLVLALTALMVLALSTVSLAGTASIDYLMGTWGLSGDDGDVTGIAFALDAPFDPFKFGIDYFASTSTGGTLPGDEDSTIWELEFGYLVSATDSLNFYINLGYLSLSGDNTDDTTAYMLSADLNFLISDASSLDISLGFSVAGEVESVDVSVIAAQIKYNYFFSDSVGLGVGYRYYNFAIDTTGDPELNISGLTLGVSFKF
jgi:hypothetical protein